MLHDSIKTLSNPYLEQNTASNTIYCPYSLEARSYWPGISCKMSLTNTNNTLHCQYKFHKTSLMPDMLALVEPE